MAHSNLGASCTKTSGSSRGRSCTLALNYSFESMALKVEFIKTEWVEENHPPYSVTEINKIEIGRAVTVHEDPQSAGISF